MPTEDEVSLRRSNLSAAKQALLEKRMRGELKGTSDAQSIHKRPPHGLTPLSFAQQRLWFLDQLEEGSPAYNLPEAWHFRGPLNVNSLERSLKEIVQRHEALRTTFVTEEGQPVQVITPQETFTLPLIDLREIAESERQANLQQLITKEAGRPLYLSQGPLMRAVLFQLDEFDYVFLLVLHHIVSDGWSFGVFMQELGALYKAFSNGQPSPLPQLAIQYPDFAYWQRQWLQGEVLETQLAYWKRQLGGHHQFLQLPTDHPRPAIQTYRGAGHYLELPKALSEALNALSRREGVSLFMTLLAAFQTLLHRYAGQDDIIVGSPIANRNRLEIEGLIGFFVNTLVLRTDLSGNPTFRELLGRVREVALGAYAHQDLPFEKLVEELQPERDLSYNPLFQVMFVLQNTRKLPLELVGMDVTPLKVEINTSMFDLTLYLTEGTAGLTATFEYNTDLFEADTIRRMGSHFKTMLEGIVINPEQRLSDLPLLTEGERRQLLVDWNNTTANYPRETCIHELFEAQVGRTPDKVAVVFEGEQLTYRELNDRANQLAHYLRKLGIRPEVLAGIFIERSLEMVIGMLGVLKAGGAYIPIDPVYPQDRVAFLLQDAQIHVLLTQKRFRGSLPKNEANVVCLDSDWDDIAQESRENPFSGVKSENAAYVIYTSGSTGTPKGVIGLHRGAVNRFDWMWRTYPFERDEICCQKTSLSFVDSVWEIFGPLLRGVPTVIIPDVVLKDPQALVQNLAAHRVTRLVLVPSLLRSILQNFPELQSHLPDLKIWITSGEALSIELAQQFLKSLPKSILINLYGSSEVSADSTFYDTSKEKLHSCIPIGRPIDNTQVYLLDSNLNPVPIGVRGELHMGGDGLARGYLGRPELTKERFIENPFVKEPGSRLYKTGDLARYLPGGNIEFLGRLDHQVKIRGFRVELGEIETVLEQHPVVRQTVVMAREDMPGDKRLVAYVVPNEKETISVSMLRDYLRKKLPEYMLPNAFLMLEKFPLTPNGKVDRRSLPSPTNLRPELESVYVAPGTEIEETVAAIWQEVLHLKKVGVNDNFFDLGGHSLVMAQVRSKLVQKLQRPLSMLELFIYPTINSLARYLSQEKNEQMSPRNNDDRIEKLKEGKDRLKQRFKHREQG